MVIIIMFPIFLMMVVDLVLYATKVLHLRPDRKAPAPFQNEKSQDSPIVTAEPMQLHKGSSLTSLSSLRSSTSIASSLNVPVNVTKYSPAIRASDIHRRIPRRAND
ncbi:hypothetical protein LJB42_004873 [Komagataella kurtzmanii]|nr:hypothetical protein LJB42_004873 [Komagataella kurtzmanii]